MRAYFDYFSLETVTFQVCDSRTTYFRLMNFNLIKEE